VRRGGPTLARNNHGGNSESKLHRQGHAENEVSDAVQIRCYTVLSEVTYRLLILPLQRNIRVRKTESVHEQLSPNQLVPCTVPPTPSNVEKIER